MTMKSILSQAIRIALVFILFAVFFIAGSAVTVGKMPVGESEPGLVSDGAGLFIMVAAETAILTALILTSRYEMNNNSRARLSWIMPFSRLFLLAGVYMLMNMSFATMFPGVAY